MQRFVPSGQRLHVHTKIKVEIILRIMIEMIIMVIITFVEFAEKSDEKTRLTIVILDTEDTIMSKTEGITITKRVL